MTSRAVLVLACLVLAAGCGSGEEASQPTTSESTTAGGGGGQTVAISETEFALDPSSVSLDETGTVTFTVTNDGSFDHALTVDGPELEKETATIAPGESAELTVVLAESGEYELYCPIGNHRDQGMEGTLTVGGQGTTGGTTTGGTTTKEDEGSGGYGY